MSTLEADCNAYAVSPRNLPLKRNLLELPSLYEPVPPTSFKMVIGADKINPAKKRLYIHVHDRY